MDVSDEDLQRFLEGEPDPVMEAVQKLPQVFVELCKEFDRVEAFELVKDYWNWLLDGIDAVPVGDDEEESE